MPNQSTEIERLVSLHRQLAQKHLVYGSSGNASFLDRERQTVWIKSSGCRCENVQLKDLVPVHFDTHQPTREGLKPSTDTELHLKIYAKVASADWVIHTHSVFATAYSILGKSLPAYVSGTVELFGSHIVCVPFASDRQQLALLLDRELSAATRACLLERHGPLVWGKSADDALAAAEALEWSAQIALLAKSQDFSPMREDHVKRYASWYEENYGQKKK